MGCCYSTIILYKQRKELEKCTNDFKLFSLDGLTVIAKVVDVYDGDTLKACFYWEGKIRKFNCRCAGYDSPEMKLPKNVKNRDANKKKAIAARERLKELVNFEKGTIELNLGKFDKYGRLLITMYNKKYRDSINSIMIAEGHGYPYYGGTKRTNF